jgi:hypothetical protein
MNKKVYQKPSMKAIALCQRAQLLTGSAVQASRSSYGEANTQEWDSE